jgi:uncharacterized protein (DUF305 family)
MKHHVHGVYVVVALLIGIGVGFSVTPEYAQMKAEKQNPMMMIGKADVYVDLRFIDGMIAHHLAAIYLAEQAKKQSTRPEVLALSDTIISVDTEGIAKLYEQKKSWFGNTKKIAQYAKVQLGNGDEQFDLRFINALVAHHEEAIEVAREMQTKSTRSDVLNLASGVISGLSEGIQTLKAWRGAWYGINR